MLIQSDLLNLLDKSGINYKIHNHAPLFTVEDSERLRGVIEGSHSKNLFLKNKKNQFFLFSCSENASVDLKLFSKVIAAKNLSFANEKYLDQYLGIKPGSVSPFALLNDEENQVVFYLDEKLFKSETISFHPLINTSTITMKTKDFINFIIGNNKKINIFSLDNYSILDVL